MSTNNEGTPTEPVRRFTLASWVSIYGRSCYLDFVKESDYAALERSLTATKQRLEVALAHNEFLCDALSAFEWQRINAMSHAEVHKELLDAGYTQESLDAGLAKIRAVAEAAIAKRNAETAALHPSVDKAESNEGGNGG